MKLTVPLVAVGDVVVVIRRVRERLQQVRLVLEAVLNVRLERVVAAQQVRQLVMRIGYVKQQRRRRALEAAERRLPAIDICCLSRKLWQNLCTKQNENTWCTFSLILNQTLTLQQVVQRCPFAAARNLRIAGSLP